MFYLLSVFLLFGALIRTNKQGIFLLISFVILFILSGFRDVNVGTDTSGYQELFRRLERGGTIRQEIGWQYLNKLVIYLGGKFEHLMIMSSFLILVPVFYVSRKYSTNPMFSIFLYFAFYIYLQSYNITRQSIAISIILVAYTLLVKRHYWSYLILIIGASFFHVTALLCLPLLFINKLPDRSFIYLTFIGTSLIAGVFLSNLILQKSTALFGYQHYLERFDSGVGIGAFLLLTNAFAVFIVYTAKERGTLFKLFIAYVVFSNLAIAVPFGYRVTFYFTIIQILFFPTYINSNILKSKQLAFFLVVIYAYLIFLRSFGAGEIFPYTNRLFLWN